MMKTLGLAALIGVSVAAPALADDDIEFPLTSPYYPIQRSYLSNRAVVLPRYRRVFPVRIYTTPQQQPYYNVPPYPVVAPE